MDHVVVFNNLQSVLQAASSKCKVIAEKFPSKFFEKDPAKIFESYKKFLKPKLDGEGNIKNKDHFPVTTIAEKFSKNEYIKKPDAFYRLYHDIKLVCTLLIHFYPQGTRTYQMVDKFYKFATELLLRECYRYGVSMVDESEEQYNDEKTLFNKQVSRDFIKISVGYSVPYAESYYISSGGLDLFSSTISKSQLDHRTTEPPNSSFVSNKIVPQTGNEIAPKLGFVAANVSNIPDPTLPPSEMMTKFLHPNWYALPTTVWLEYGDFKSWAPSFNESGTVLDAARRGTIWLEKTGYSSLWKLKNKHKDALTRESSDEEVNKENKSGNVEGASAEIETFKPSDVSEQIEASEELSPQEDAESGTSPNNVPNGTGSIEKSENQLNDNETRQDSSASALVTSDSLNIKLENLYEWSPGNDITDEEIQAISEGNTHKLITQTLLVLGEMKRKRVKSKKVSKPTAKEAELYYRAQRLLREVMLAKKIESVPQIAAKSFPVLQANYMGSVPVVRTIQTRKKKYKK
ncbi:LAQU0S07e01882g1_1 [Lachancea quebecensis]|uniref:LAQU0S07e01882g1_1 n=1 Tax=Lachancea quebecensis TaxID=1654605 RepID=A0A0P1KSC6_9SACH|nr:LAQU0S07e01882g1_1 [Lachancea quebecensis]